MNRIARRKGTRLSSRGSRSDTARDQARIVIVRNDSARELERSQHRGHEDDEITGLGCSVRHWYSRGTTERTQWVRRLNDDCLGTFLNDLDLEA